MPTSALTTQPLLRGLCASVVHFLFLLQVALSEWQGVHGLGLRATANGEISVAHEGAADTVHHGHDEAEQEDRHEGADQEPVDGCESSHTCPPRALPVEDDIDSCEHEVELVLR